MPTPSSEPPLDPSSPPSYTFSTCPDELQHLSQTAQSSREEMTPGLESPSDRRSQSPHETPSVDSEQSRNMIRGDSLVTDDRISAESSSRATTVSPRPRSSANGALSPPSDIGNGKQQGLERRSSTRQPAVTGSPSPSSAANRQEENDSEPETYDDHTLSSCYTGLDYSNKRSIPFSPSSYLRPGTKFHGTQQSERQVYEVQVEIKYVDMRESFLCGYLRIQGLTEDHPTLTTYFEGEIIGTRYSFITQHDDWGANSKVDISHWSKFGAFRPYSKRQGKKGSVIIPDVAQKEFIFMRWKEHFLVPDHRVRTIHGASFEGFYYICFNQVKGEVSGIYFHSKSEKFQQLELKYVPDRGCFMAMEFR
ncbi:vesicle-mediated transport protein Vid24 [Cordyceps fumosorosea ARSEF 2679]|uniref:Vesicle-mediated transport protein Vid24 n=1 Tax=Cordyceps fumosorosea (strain ARSEF 2679) TaxID=1081104 RepID=A0A167LG03_CORFA|nr:vesicle-mediated transport protein Vid24 [Cordyceps fumosorosea ARSEF 2679]OAA53043.1 vesicle-mediated transport protein Vid24 [Cordyceps fumosorosea ARSEF 2679]